MNNQKKSKGKSKFASILSRRQFRYGGYATVLTAIVIAIVILLNVAVGMVEDNWALSIDVTAMEATDFSEETEKVVGEVAEEVHVYTLYQTATSSSIRVQVEAVLNKYRALNKNIIIDNIDPVSEPTRVNQYAGDADLSEGAIVVTNADESRVKLIDRKDYYYYYSSQYNNQTYTIFDLESKMTGALVYVTSTETPRVFYLAGHDELDAETYATMLTKQLESQNYDVSTLNLTSNEAGITLEAGDTLVVINPQRDLSDAEYEIIRKWIVTGGRMLFSLGYEVDTEKIPNFMKILDYYQMSFGDGIIQEDKSASSNWSGDQYSLVPNLNAEDDVTKALSEAGMYMLMPYSRPINEVTMPESGLQFNKLLTSTAKSVVVNGDETSMPGEQILAMTMLKSNGEAAEDDVRIALIGNIYALADTNLLNYSYNMTFTTNVFNWLVNRDTNVDISSKLLPGSTLAIPDAATGWLLGGIVVIAIPLIVVIAGVVVWIKRRSL